MCGAVSIQYDPALKEGYNFDPLAPCDRRESLWEGEGEG